MKVSLKFAGLFFITMGLLGACARPGKRFDRTVLATGNSQDEVKIREVRALMDGIRFPRVSLDDVTISEAISWIQANIPKHWPDSGPKDSDNLGFYIGGRVSAQQLRPYRGTPPPAPKLPEERVTIHLDSATVPEVLDAICAQHGYIWQVTAMAVAIVPKETLLRNQQIATERRKLMEKYRASR